MGLGTVGWGYGTGGYGTGYSRLRVWNCVCVHKSAIPPPPLRLPLHIKDLPLHSGTSTAQLQYCSFLDSSPNSAHTRGEGGGDGKGEERGEEKGEVRGSNCMATSHNNKKAYWIVHGVCH